MKNVKTLLIFMITSTLLLASAQRVNSLGGNVGYWADDDNSWTAFPHTINNSNLAQVSDIGSDGSHNAIVRWGEGTKWGFAWNQANANDMINLQWGNGSMGATFGLNMSSDDDGSYVKVTLDIFMKNLKLFIQNKKLNNQINRKLGY